MREIQILKWCDMCANEDDGRTPAVDTFTVGIVPGEVRPVLKLVELCEPHGKHMVDLLELLDLVGQTPEFKTVSTVAPARASNGIGRHPFPDVDVRNPFVECPICREQVRQASRVNHIWASHLGGLSQRSPGPTHCPECGKAFAPQGMASHRKMMHGHDLMTELLELYEKRQAKRRG